MSEEKRLAEKYEQASQDPAVCANKSVLKGFRNGKSISNAVIPIQLCLVELKVKLALAGEVGTSASPEQALITQACIFVFT